MSQSPDPPRRGVVLERVTFVSEVTGYTIARVATDRTGPDLLTVVGALLGAAIKDVMVFLAGVGVSTSLAVRIYKKYADTSIEVVRTEPYRLASDVWGIGFKTADTIAAAVGIPA